MVGVFPGCDVELNSDGTADWPGCGIEPERKRSGTALMLRPGLEAD